MYGYYTRLVRMDDTYMGIADESIELGPYQNEVRTKELAAIRRKWSRHPNP